MNFKVICKGKRANGKVVELPVRRLDEENTFYAVSGAFTNTVVQPLAIGSIAFANQWGAKQFRLIAQVEGSVLLYVNGDYEETLVPSAGKVQTGNAPEWDLRDIKTVVLSDSSDRVILKADIP